MTISKTNSFDLITSKKQKNTKVKQSFTTQNQNDYPLTLFVHKANTILTAKEEEESEKEKVRYTFKIVSILVSYVSRKEQK